MRITIDNANVSVEGGKVIIDLDSEQLENIVNANNVQLSTLKTGSKFKLGDEVFIVLEQTDNGTRVISKSFAYHNVKFGDKSDWKASPIRKTLNNDYFKKIAAIIGKKNILSMNRDLTSIDGLDDYGACIDKVSLLTTAEYAKYHNALGLMISYPNWWWTITPASTPSNDYFDFVCAVTRFGLIGGTECDSSHGVRPFLNLRSSILVSI